MEAITVLIVDDHEVVRLGLKAALEAETDIVVVGDAGDGATGVSEAEAHRPDVVLMDVRMPDMDGIEACRAIRESLPDTKVVMLTSYTDDDAVMASIMAGACGYLLKNTGKAELVEAVRRASRGESLLDPAITTPIMARLRDLAAKEEDREVAVSAHGGA